MPDPGPGTMVDVEKMVVIAMRKHHDVLAAVVGVARPIGDITVGVPTREKILSTNLLMQRFGEVHVDRFLQQHYESRDLVLGAVYNRIVTPLRREPAAIEKHAPQHRIRENHFGA